MAVTSWKAFGTAASDSSNGGTEPWETPSNVLTDDTSRANLDMPSSGSQVSEYLLLTNIGLTTGDVPSGATIDGIEFRYRREEDSRTDNLHTSKVRIIKGGTVHTSNVSTMNTAEWDNSPETITEGGASNLWGQTFTDSDVRASNFGVAVEADAASGVTPDGGIQYAEIRIYYTESSGVTGSGSLSLDDVSVSGSGSVLVSGSGSLTLDDVSGSGAGSILVSGSGALSLDDVTASGSGQPKYVGSGAGALDDVAVSGSGNILVQGSGSPSLDDVTASGAGVIPVQGSGTPSLEDVTVSGVGSAAISGTGALSIDDVTVSGAGAIAVQGAGALGVDDISASGSGAVAISGSGALSLDDVSVSGTGSLSGGAITGSGALTLDSVGVSSNAYLYPFVAYSAINSGTGTQATVDWPDDIRAGDEVQLLLTKDGQHTVTTPPTDFTYDSTKSSTTQTNNENRYYEKTATGSESGTISSATWADSEEWVFSIVVIRNTSGFDKGGFIQTDSNFSSFGFSSTTPTYDNSLIIGWGAGGNASSTWTLPNGADANLAANEEFDQSQGTTTAGVSQAFGWHKQGSATATGTMTFAQSTSAPYYALYEIWKPFVTAATGSGAINLDDVGASGVGAVPVSGAGAPSLEDIAVSGSGSIEVQGSGAASLDDVSVSGAGGVLVQGSGSVNLDDITASGSSSAAVQGAGSLTLDDISVSGSGIVAIQGAGTLSIDDISASGSGNAASAIAEPTGGGVITPHWIPYANIPKQEKQAIIQALRARNEVEKARKGSEPKGETLPPLTKEAVSTTASQQVIAAAYQPSISDMMAQVADDLTEPQQQPNDDEEAMAVILLAS